VVTTQIIVLLENYVRLHGAEKKLFHFLLVVRVHVRKLAFARDSTRVRACACEKKTYITAAVKQLLFRVKTERNLKLKSY